MLKSGTFDPKTPLLHHLRYEEAATGTKWSCGQGACGGCTVSVARQENGEVKHSSANSCLIVRPLFLCSFVLPGRFRDVSGRVFDSPVTIFYDVPPLPPPHPIPNPLIDTCASLPRNQPVAALEGCDVTTVEGIGSSHSELHPVQERIAGYNGSQCGFCTPGMVMSMYSLLKKKDGEPTLEDVSRQFDGNLCRCTGYRSIFQACQVWLPPRDVG